jgi:hypothetical protein
MKKRLDNLIEVLKVKGFQEEALAILKLSGQIPAGMQAFQLRTGLFGGSDYDSPFDVAKKKKKKSKTKKSKTSSK